MTKTVLFYANVKNPGLLREITYYEQDIRALEDSGYHVIISNSYLDLFFRRYDFVYVWWWTYSLVPVLWSRISRKKCIVAGAFHYSTPLTRGNDFVRRSIFYKMFVLASLRLAHANVFVSNAEYQSVIANLKVNNPFIVYHGIDTEKYCPLPLSDPSRHPASSVKSILMLSWLETHNIERKCVAKSVQAICRLFSLGYPLRLQIAGRPGPGYEKFIEFLGSQPGSECVELLGHVTEGHKIELMRTADIFLSPTLYEGFGIAIAEALACGAAVITSNHGATYEVAGDSALYCDPLSVQSILEAVKILLEDEGLLADLSLSGPSRIQRKFSYPNHSSSLALVLSSIFR